MHPSGDGNRAQSSRIEGKEQLWLSEVGEQGAFRELKEIHCGKSTVFSAKK